MIELKKVPIPAGLVQSETAVAMQESVALALRSVPDSFDIAIKEVNGGQYKTNETDQYILVDSRGGPVAIILQLPKVKQKLVIIRKYSAANPVTVSRIDGKETGNAGTSIPVTFDSATKMLSDGSQWWLEK